MCTIKMRNLSLWRLGPLETLFKRGGEAVSSIGNPLLEPDASGDGMVRLAEDVRSALSLPIYMTKLMYVCRPSSACNVCVYNINLYIVEGGMKL